MGKVCSCGKRTEIARPSHHFMGDGRMRGSPDHRTEFGAMVGLVPMAGVGTILVARVGETPWHTGPRCTPCCHCCRCLKKKWLSKMQSGTKGVWLGRNCNLPYGCNENARERPQKVPPLVSPAHGHPSHPIAQCVCCVRRGAPASSTCMAAATYETPPPMVALPHTPSNTIVRHAPGLPGEVGPGELPSLQGRGGPVPVQHQGHPEGYLPCVLTATPIPQLPNRTRPRRESAGWTKRTSGVPGD